MQLSTILLWILCLFLNRCTKAVRETKHYDTLGVSPDADDATIKSAYRREAKRWHPDRNKEMPDKAEKKFREVAEAYEVLSDPDTRSKYDRFGSQGLNEQGGGRGFGRDPFDMFQTFFQDGNVKFMFRTSYGGNMGGGGRQRQQQQQRTNRDLYGNDDAVVTQMEEMSEPGADMWVWAVNYYAPWCGHCQQMKAEWSSLAEQTEGIIKVAAVNCEKNEELCEAQDVNGYPTIKLFPPHGGRGREYEGERTAAAIRAAAYRLIPNHVLQVSNPTALEKLLSSCRGTQAKWHVCMLLFTDKANSPLYRSLAVQHSGKVSFGEAVGAAAAVREIFRVESTEKVLVAVCNGDLSTVEHKRGSLKAAGVREFVLNFTGGKRCVQSIQLNADTDFKKLRVGQLKEILSARGESCGGCLEKQDYIDKLRTLIDAAS